MADTRTAEQRRRIMQSVRGKDTAPEWTVRRLLHRLGYRYRLHPKGLPGRPDLALPGRRKAIFVNGCFWHGHRCRYGQPPKSRLDYWLPKLEQNKNRDARKRTQLEALGWSVLTVWQCEARDEAALAQRLCAFLSSREARCGILERGAPMIQDAASIGPMRRDGLAARPIGIDLFAGAGGMSLGFESAGFDVMAAVEIDPVHCATHEFNFPCCATICRSILDISGSEIRRMAGLETEDIAVVFGGAPCQGFSLIGKRALDDPRNALVYHFVRIVLELRPRYFAFENVRGLP